jgi:hypothetical protein
VRGPLVGGVLVVAAVGAALVAVVLAGPSCTDATSLEAVVGEAQCRLGLLAAVQVAAEKLNIVRGVGGLAGLGLGVAVGSVATYARWRR